MFIYSNCEMCLVNYTCLVSVLSTTSIFNIKDGLLSLLTWMTSQGQTRRCLIRKLCSIMCDKFQSEGFTERMFQFFTNDIYTLTSHSVLIGLTDEFYVCKFCVGFFCSTFMTSYYDLHLKIPNEYVTKLNDSIQCEN